MSARFTAQPVVGFCTKGLSVDRLPLGLAVEDNDHNLFVPVLRTRIA